VFVCLFVCVSVSTTSSLCSYACYSFPSVYSAVITSLSSSCSASWRHYFSSLFSSSMTSYRMTSHRMSVINSTRWTTATTRSTLYSRCFKLYAVNLSMEKILLIRLVKLSVHLSVVVCRLSSSSVTLHCMAGQSCYVTLGRHLVSF